MNNNSLLCNFIKENWNNYKELLELKHIKIKYKDNLAIFNYNIDANFNDPIVKESRGIIIDLNTLDTVCWPFNKFGNIQESYADTIDWNTAKVQEKIDGSIIKLYYYNNKWNFATNSCVYANDAKSVSGKTFLQLIHEAENYSKIPFSTLDKNKTYIFELVTPDNQIVVNYNKTYLYHIGTRNNVNGKELNTDIDIEKPKLYDIDTADAALEAVEKLNSGNKADHEGFVVVDGNWHRVKIKSPEYIALHHIIENGRISKKHVISLIRKDESMEIELCAKFPSMKHIIKFYSYQLAELYYQANYIVNYSRGLYEEYSHERKAVALKIKDNKYSAIGFKALGTDKNVLDILNKLTETQYLKYIDDYK